MGWGHELEHKPEIDGLRAIAVAAVVIYHAFPGALPGGFVGVDIFFVISGYLITALLAREWADSGRVDFVAFYARRVRRLLPPLAVMLVGVLALMVGLMGRHESLVADAATSSIWSLVFAVNFHFQATMGGYFDVAADARPMLHLWSLAVEEQFYLVYPWLLVALLGLAPGTPARRLAMIALASFLLSEYWSNVEPVRGFYQMPSRFWELAAGGLVALAPALPARPTMHLRHSLPIGLTLILLSCALADRWGAFPGKSALAVVAGTSLALLAIHRGEATGWSASMLRSKAFVALGLVSYSLYLWHWPLLVMAKQAWIQPAGPGLRIAACVLALLLATLSWRIVEAPVRRIRIRQPWRWLRAGLLVALLSCGSIAGLSMLDRVPADARKISGLARNDIPMIKADCHFEGNRDVQALLPPSCNSRPAQAPTFALWGDSHAAAWQPFAWRLAKVAGASAAPLTLNSCPPGATWVEGGVGANCEKFNRVALQWLTHEPVDTIVVTQRWPRDPSPGGREPEHLAARVDALGEALAALGHVRRIMVVGPLPTTPRAAPDCIALGWEHECSSPVRLYRKRVAPVWRRLEALSKRYPNVVLLDPAEYFCDETSCPPARHGFGLYRDDNHITASAASGFAEAYLANPERYTRCPGGCTSKMDPP